MMPNCVRCNRPGFALIELKATIGRSTLALSEHAEQPALCAVCTRELAAWFGVGDQTEHTQLGATLGGRLGSRLDSST